jgi:LysM repeat protein
VVPPHGYAVRLPKGSKEIFQVAYANMDRSVRPPSATRRGTRHRRHRVRRGETVASIAEQHQVSVAALLRVNRIRDPRSLQAGQTLRLPPAEGDSGTAILVAKRKTRSNVLD